VHAADRNTATSDELPADFDLRMQSYYARRAPTYEDIYRRRERQADLVRVRSKLAMVFAGKRVLDIACGTGYFTEAFAPAAREVIGIDAAEETLDIARGKHLPNTRFMRGNAYELDPALVQFDAAFIGFFWSHIPRQRITFFVSDLYRCLSPGATVVVLDNLYREGDSTPIAGVDDDGNGWQERPHPDGGTERVLKNYPERDDMLKALGAAPRAASTHWWRLEYYWWFDIKTGTR
jgi:ubiquinone/menaquinone biosynthesis C-methylase UbiE